jgi:hypothetical protein
MSDTPPFKLVRIHWLDAYSEGHWKDSTDEPREAPCVSVGLLVSETKKYVRLASTVGRTDEGKWETNATISIPRGMVERIETLEGGE